MEELLKKALDGPMMHKIINQLFNDNPLLIRSRMLLFEKNKTLQGTDSDKVDYYLKLLNERNLLPNATSLEEKKDDNTSVKVRKEGNLLFGSKKYLDALKAYNKSLCFAISKDNQILALTNRSAVFFKMEMYKECLKSIQLAREVGPLGSVREKVELRAKMCKKELKKIRQEKSFIPKIDMPLNEKMPFLAKCVKLLKNTQFGRYVITDEDIPAGTIIAFKEPFCKIILNEDKYIRCTYCYSEHTHLLMPCDTCTQAMFCSKECKEKAYTDFHAIECPISGSLYEIFDIHYQLAFRITVRAFLAFPDAETMAVALEKIDREQKNIFSYDWSKELSQEELYAPIRALMAKANDKLSNGVYLGTCLAFNLLKYSCPIFSQRYLTSSNADNLLKKLMCHHIHTVIMNPFSYGNVSIGRSYPREGYGEALCGFFSFINHSCAPNVTPFGAGSKYGIIAIRNISKGTQLCIDYGTHHTTDNRDTRRKGLCKRYDFHCQCEACVKDFPMLCSLKKTPDLPFRAIDARSVHERLSVKFNKRAFELAGNYIRKNSNFYPSLQLNQAREHMLTCLQLLCVVPLHIHQLSLEYKSTVGPVKLDADLRFFSVRRSAKFKCGKTASQS